MRRALAIVLVVFATAGAQTDYVRIASEGGSPIRCYVDGVEQPGTHSQEHTRDQRLANLVLSNPDADVRCSQTETIVGWLTSAGRALVEAADAAVVIPAPPASPASDWATRSTQPGVFYAQRFDSATPITATANGSGAGGSLDDDDGGVYGEHFSWDQGPDNGGLIPTSSDGGNGVLRFDVYYYDTSGRGNWITPEWSEVFDTAGEEFWVQFRVWHTFNFAHYAHRGSGSSNDAPYGEGFKTAIVSGWTSNQIYEIVMQKLDNYGLVRGYHQRDGAVVTRGWDQSYSSNVNGSDFRFQGTDQGGSTATYADELRRYGGLYSYENTQPTVESFPFIMGRPDPFTGGWRYYENEWVTYQLHVEIVTASTTRYTWYAARERDSAFTQISPVVTETSMSPEYSRLWLLPYETQGAAEPGGDTWGPWATLGAFNSPRRQTSHVGYQSVILSTDEIAPPPARSNYLIEDEILELSPGSFSADNPFTMTGFNNALVASGGITPRTIVEYGSKGFYDPFRKELIFKGGGHGFAPDNSENNAVIRYDLADNSWTRQQGSTTQEEWYLHGYERSALDTTGGRFFTTGAGGSTSSQALFEFNHAAGTWTEIADYPSGTSQLGIAIEYFPELGGLVMFAGNTAGASLFNFETETWEDLGIPTNNSYHMLARYNKVRAQMYLYGGNRNADSNNAWMLDRYGNITEIADPPFTIGPSDGLLFVVEDPESQYYGDYIAFNRESPFDIRIYSPDTDTWSASIGTFPINPSGDNHESVGIPIPTVNGILFFYYSNGLNFRLYRMPQ